MHIAAVTKATACVSIGRGYTSSLSHDSCYHRSQETAIQPVRVLKLFCFSSAEIS